MRRLEMTQADRSSASLDPSFPKLLWQTTPSQQERGEERREDCSRKPVRRLRAEMVATEPLCAPQSPAQSKGTLNIEYLNIRALVFFMHFTYSAASAGPAPHAAATGDGGEPPSRTWASPSRCFADRRVARAPRPGLRADPPGGTPPPSHPPRQAGARAAHTAGPPPSLPSSPVGAIPPCRPSPTWSRSLRNAMAVASAAAPAHRFRPRSFGLCPGPAGPRPAVLSPRAGGGAASRAARCRYREEIGSIFLPCDSGRP
ncbi:translation initiation factor IF-2-like [Hyaena hyaena]|uniref:translation initiation factor IF-2-like n=1 Tax=Hyaena hyaena TaxID=95912 RepID=UPI0019237AA6|nr:translation initiation factor IF-2-like [Hyaena hyaena]